DMTISGLEDEYNLSGSKPKLIYIKSPAPDREPRLTEMLTRIKNDNISYKYFTTTDELREAIENDLALLLSEGFETARPSDTPIVAAPPRRTNLTQPPTPLIGRERERADVCALLKQDTVSLITLIGLGGAGKTRLAWQVALDLLDQFSDGAFFVDLAAINDPDRVPALLASTLDVRETTGSRSLSDSVQGYLSNKQMLLVLDNFEQVITAAPLIAALVQACPSLKLLATSRTPLHIRAEREFPLAPFALPDQQHWHDLGALEHNAAIQLFIDRASLVRPDFALTDNSAPIIAEICARLDGLPLAIELAAARVKLLSPQMLLERLRQNREVLKSAARDLPARQQTLHNTIKWSCDLLDADVQNLFRRLAVFAGGWTLDMAETVCNGDGTLQDKVFDSLGILLDNSLIKSVEAAHGEPRFSMLLIVHEYARQRLVESGEAEQVKRWHAESFLTLAEQANLHARTINQREWIDRLEIEYDNLRTAHEWFNAQPDRTPDDLRLAGVMFLFWLARGRWTEGRQWIAQTLKRPLPGGMSPQRAQVLNCAALLAVQQSDSVTANACLDESIPFTRQVGDRLNLAYGLSILGLEKQTAGDVAIARTLHAESIALFRALKDHWGLGFALFLDGMAAYWQGDYAAARGAYEESVVLFRTVGDKWRAAGPLGRLGDLAFRLGDSAEAHRLYSESLALFREASDKAGIATALNPLGTVALKDGDLDQALAYYRESLAINQELGEKQNAAWAHFGLGRVAFRQCDFVQAESSLQRALSLLSEVGDSGGITWVIQFMGQVNCAQGNTRGATLLFAMALEMAQQQNHAVTIAFCFPGFAHIAAQNDQPQLAAQLLGMAEAWRSPVATTGSALDLADYDQLLAEARGTIDTLTYADRIAEGRAMPQAEAIAFALRTFAEHE
ncbi:MAG TPA: tetratricopeptide repeat protein, partial [Anaerolineae bacterium]|nr:tetratricopeptide repeat protein [Anaerolineae bacterium]